MSIRGRRGAWPCRCALLQSARVTVRIGCQEQAMTFVSDASLPLRGMPDSTPTPPAFQMTLIGQPHPVRIPEHLWRSWLDDPAAVPRFKSKCYRRRNQCWPLIEGVSSTEHDSFWAASLPGRLAAGPCRRLCSPTSSKTMPFRGRAVRAPTTRCCAIHVTSPAAPTRHTCDWEPIAATAANANSGDETSPAPSPTFEDPRVALAPSLPRSVSGSSRTCTSPRSKSA